MTWTIIKVVWLVIVHLLAVLGGFAAYGGVRQYKLRRRTETKLERDIKEWARIKKQYNNDSNAKKN